MTRFISRRGLLRVSAGSAGAIAAGGLTVLFQSPAAAQISKLRSESGAGGPASVLDAWIRIAPDGGVTAFTGKAELGQGIATAIAQLAAEGLQVSLNSVRVVTADTARAPNEMLTVGSHSVETSGATVLAAATHARNLMIGFVAEAWGVAPDRVSTVNGVLKGPAGRTRTYGDAAAKMNRTAPVPPMPIPPRARPGGAMGASPTRIDIPAKVFGQEAFIQDMRPEGLVHARVVRAPSRGLRLATVETEKVALMPGVLAIVRQGGFLAVVAEKEWQAANALTALEGAARWTGSAALFEPGDLSARLLAGPAQTLPGSKSGSPGGGVKRLAARYSRPYLMHASIGPSCAFARFDEPYLTVWTHSQGVFVLRGALAGLLGMPAESIRCVHVAGSGCYGHNGADDVAADAAVIARAVPGKTVRLQWTRLQEHRFEPYGPAMVGEVEGALDSTGRIVDWKYVVSSYTHLSRPFAPGFLLAAGELPNGPKPPPPMSVPLPEGDGHRNSIPLYDLPNQDVTYRLLPDQPLRTSSLRGLGAHLNVIAIEGFMDELAAAAGADPVAFRRRHLSDPRALAVIAETAKRFDWSPRAKSATAAGRGFGFARYKNLAGYCAVALEVMLDQATGKIAIGRVVSAYDVGQPVSPDGVANQVEGGIIQGLSWTMLEAVGFGAGGQKADGWPDYPILRFSDLPVSIELAPIERSAEPFLGAGEISTGPASAALVNAISNALGVRVRDLPLTPARLLSARSQAAAEARTASSAR